MKIYIEPKNRCGSIEHYYHFLFGYLLPFIQNNAPDSLDKYYFHDCGPMNVHLRNLPRYNINIAKKNNNYHKVKYLGFDFCYDDMKLDYIKNIIYNIFNIDHNLHDKNIILIDRDKPDSFYLKNAKIKGSGSSRRHIPNIIEIYDYLLSKGLNIKKVYLENMSLADQIILFKTASTIICQHGAAMSNLIWANEKTTVIEVRTMDNPLCYEPIMNMCNLNHKKILQKHEFGFIDPKTIYNAIKM